MTHVRASARIRLERGLDVSAKAGVILSAAAVGASYQPNLLTRGTRDQAIITGIAAATGYGWGSSAHSAFRSVADRFPASGRSLRGAVTTGLVVDGVVLAAGLAVARAVPPREHESPRRALLRLGANVNAAAAAAGLVATALEPVRFGRGRVSLGLASALAVGAGTYAAMRPRRQVAGAHAGTGFATEDVVREVSPPKAAAMGVAVTIATFGLARAEAALTGAVSRGAAVVLGGTPDQHRAIGRLGAFGISGWLGWRALSFVTAKLQTAGSGVEAAHAQAPDVPEVTGSAESGVPWAAQSREGRRWLSMVLRPQQISDVMGESARQPIRVYAALDAAATPEDRAALLLREIDRTKALERKVFALFSPTGSGYVNYVACETLEYLTRGDCASACIEYSVLPSSLSLTDVPLGTHQTRMVMDGLVQRLMAMPAESRPRMVLFGESLGSQVSEEVFEGTGATGPAGVGLDAALWIGTPAATKWRKQLWGRRSISVPPRVGPGDVLVTRSINDWHDLPDAEKDQVRYLLLQNGDDPIPKFEAPLLWRRPDWLGPDDTRPPGAPLGTRWVPVATFFATFIDLLNALVPTPGVFVEGGHDYRLVLPQTLRRVWRLEASDDQMERVEAALRSRELEWETRRQWLEAAAAPDDKRAEAQQKVEHEVAEWTGKDGVDAAAVERIANGDAG